jgi:serine/threonine-protein kinase
MASTKPPASDERTPDLTRTDDLVLPSLSSRPSTPAGDDGPRSRRAEALAAMRALSPRRASEVVETGDVVGEGGMGLVRAAVQRSVGRTVVVKSLRGQARGPEEEVRLLREAWLTASLEHPSVVPVHDVIVDPEVGPLILSRKIEGVVWDSVIDDADAVRERFHADDLFVFNVETLMQLCRVIHFAHSRGIVHRDLKPSNVMIGDYGEVYLLDWGIAVSLEDDPSGRLPLATEGSGGAGTPSYMAPEMLDPSPGRCDRRTDVYLLGAVLYRIATGKAPHARENDEAVMASIGRGRPVFPPGVPDQLQAVIARAMARAPEDRYESAEELRLELKRLLRARDSTAMVDEALGKLAEVRASLEGATEVLSGDTYALFGGCRFALQQALRLWPGNERAQLALGDLLHHMALHLLARGEIGAARALVAEHPSPAPELLLRIERAEREEEQRRAEFESMRRENDPGVGRGARRAALGLMGLLWTVAPLLADVVDPTTTPAWVHYLGPATLLAIASGVWYGARESLAQTTINRRFLVSMLAGFCAHMVHILAVELGGLPVRSELAQGMVSFGAITAVLAYTAERRLWPLAPVYWLGALVAAAFRDVGSWVLAGANLILTVYLFAIWSPGKVVGAAPSATGST